MRFNFQLLFAFAICLGLTTGSCSSGGDEHDGHDHAHHDHDGHDHGEHEELTDNVEPDDRGVSLTLAEDASEFPNAGLQLNAPAEGSKLNTGNTTFEFSVSDYELGAQTEGHKSGACANSGKGQHIHFILNNGPYAAHYEPNVMADLPEGKHLLLAFLSRSYHESIKNGKAFVTRQLNVGNTDGAEDYDMDAPMLFYSRPKGTYTGKDARNILLDFFLVNADLASDGYKVKAVIDGQEFMLDKWAPYVVEGLKMGEHTFQIVLLDAEGNPVPGPFNDSGIRTITLQEEAPAS